LNQLKGCVILKAADNMKKQGERMRKQAGGRPDTMRPDLAIGTVVLVPIDKVDRGSCDARHIPGVVVEVTEHSNYRIACKGGVLKDCLSRGTLRVESRKTPESYGLEDWLNVNIETAPKQSLREAAASYSVIGGQGMKKCGCKGSCIAFSVALVTSKK
jgi:hypothetical protein